jgi:hypothetical protein
MNWWDDSGNYIRNEYGTLPYNDSWSSEDGENWVKEKNFSHLPPRGGVNGYVEFNNRLLIIGGGTSNGGIRVLNNDIWATTGLVTWQIVDKAAFPPTFYNTIINKDGRLFILIGDEDSGSVGVYDQSNQSWYSDDGGYTWKQIKYGFYTKRHASGIISFKGKLYMVAGAYSRDVWVLDEERL